MVGPAPEQGTLEPCGPADAEGEIRERIQTNGRCEASNDRGDTYGPVSYLAYVPGYWLFGWTGIVGLANFGAMHMARTQAVTHVGRSGRAVPEWQLVGDVIVRGGMPYRDAFDVKGPLSFYPSAFVQLVTGRTWWGIRAFDLRRSRYRGLAKTSLQHLLTAAGMNLNRLNAWLDDTPLAATRTSHFAALRPAA